MRTFLVFALTLIIFGCTLIPQRSLAQNEAIGRVANTLFVEGFGNGKWYSLNYDRLLSSNVALRVGFNFTPAVPVTLSYLLRVSSSDHIELGIGILPTFGASPALDGTAILGYRYQQPNGGLFIKAAITPFLGTSGITWWAGGAIGLTF
jgi:hypothetical protein